MHNVIKRTADAHGIHRYLRNIDLVHYPIADWVHDPNVATLDGVTLERYWDVSGDTVSEMSQSEKDAVDLSLKESRARTSKYGELMFGNRGKTRNRWLRIGGLFLSSQHMPMIVVNDGDITGITYVNYANSSDTDIEVYINGSLKLTWDVRSKRYAYKTRGLASLSFNAGDRIGIKLKGTGSTDPVHPVLTIQYRYDSQFTGEGGSSTL